MAKATSGVPAASRFFGWVRPREAAPAPDPADLGTAFGLELSLGEPTDWPADVGAGTTAEEPELREPPRF